MRILFFTFFLLLFEGNYLSQTSYFSFGLNYSWLDKIETTVPGRQVISPGFILNYGRDYAISQNFGCYASANLNWISGGAIWKLYPDLSVKSNFNMSRLELETGFTFRLNESLKFAFGLNNSFGAKLSGKFTVSEQNTFRNWVPFLIPKLTYRKNEIADWAFSLKIAQGLRTAHYIIDLSPEINIRYESSFNHAAFEIIRYIH